MTQRFEEFLAAAASLDFDVVARKVEGFSAPQQERARRKTEMILAGTAQLLDERAFADISVNDIAQIADCSVATIYSRFREKDVLLPVIYILARRNYAKKINPEKIFQDKTLEGMCISIAMATKEWFVASSNMERAFVNIYNNNLRNIISDMNCEFYRRINPLVAGFLERDPNITFPSVQLAVNVNMTMYRDANLIRPIDGVATYPDPGEMARLMALIIRSCQASGQGGDPK